MAEPNQKLCYLNRKSRAGNEQYVNFITEPTYDILSQLNTYGAVLTYFYLCSLVPHTIDGKKYKPEKGFIKSAPYEISPAALQKVYPGHDISTFQHGINRLIELKILRPVNGNLYIFDDIPIEYRVKTYEEHQEMVTLNAEEAFKYAHDKQIEEMTHKLQKTDYFSS